MPKLLRPAFVLLGIFTLVTGVVYPVFVTIAAQKMFPAEANGSPLRRNSCVVGSGLIGQAFHDVKYFWGRPSATSPSPYNAAASSGSNLGPSNPGLVEAVRRRVAELVAADHETGGTPVPVDLVTASGSGLDPHISPAAAQFQVGRVARARGLSVTQVRQLVDRFTEGRTLGVIGESRVNVLRLNVALDDLANPGA